MVMYMQDTDGTEILIPGKAEGVDLSVGKAWRSLGVDFKSEREGDEMVG
jgi:hypothetical protein